MQAFYSLLSIPRRPIRNIKTNQDTFLFSFEYSPDAGHVDRLCPRHFLFSFEYSGERSGLVWCARFMTFYSLLSIHDPGPEKPAFTRIVAFYSLLSIQNWNKRLRNNNKSFLFSFEYSKGAILTPQQIRELAFYSLLSIPMLSAMWRSVGLRNFLFSFEYSSSISMR